MSEDPNKPKNPKGYQPPRKGRPGEERKASLNRNLGGKQKKKAEPAIQPKGLPQGARPAGVETYGSSNWRPPTHKPTRPKPAEKPPAPTLFERFPILQQWKDKIVALWRKRFPKPEGEAEGAETPDRFAKAKELKASWGEKLTKGKEAAGEKTSAASAKVGAWWTETWTKTKEKLGPPINNLKEKMGLVATKAGTKISEGASTASDKVGTWSKKGGELAQRTAQNVREKMPELPPASDMVRKIPGVSAGLDAMDAAKTKRAQAAITNTLAQTIQTLATQGVEAASGLQAEPCGHEFVEEKLANGEAAAWLDEANAANTAQLLPPALFHRPTDAMRLLAAQQSLLQEHPGLWQEGYLQPVMTLAFALHAKQTPLHLLELVVLHMTHLIASQIDDPETFQSFLWYTKQSVGIASKDDSSRVARQVLAIRGKGGLSKHTHDQIIAGLGQLV